MENKARVADKALIQVILQEYRDRSVDSITGPTAIRKYEATSGRHRVWPSLADVGVVKTKHDRVSSSKELDRQPFSPLRLLAPSGVAAAHKKPSKVKRTLLDGIPIACFNIGGEKRLCFDQLIAEVLKEFSASEVNNSRDHLKIYCPKCDEDQLESLKLSKAVAWSDSSCLLITKSDAYRLCSALLGSRAPQRHDKKYTKPFLEVYHECFGGCDGIFEPEIYNEPHAKCVTCLECYRLFSPRKFVTHSHATCEIQTCHWGMDSSKWRDYLLLPDDKADDEMTKKIWEDVKRRFFGTIRKRKLSNSEAESVAESECSESSTKKRNILLTYAVSPNVERPSGTPSSSVSSPREHSEANRRSAFRPWSPLEEKNISESTSSESQPTSNASPSQGRLAQPASHAIQQRSYRMQHSYLARNCACPSYSPVNGYVPYSTAIKSEYPSVACSQTVSQSPNSRDAASGESRRENTSTETLVQDFASPERVKQVLSKYCHRGHLPSVDELSFALAKELQEWSYGQSRVLNEVKEKGERLREEMNSLRRENTSKLDSACEELKCCQEKLDQLNRKRDEDIKEFAKTREALQRQVESLQEQRSSESDTVKKLMSQLNERDNRCRLLEKELDYIRSWYIGSQRRYPPFQTLPVAVYGGANLRDMYCSQSAVIQEIPVFSRNGESPSLSNRGKADEQEASTGKNDENESKGEKERN